MTHPNIETAINGNTKDMKGTGTLKKSVYIGISFLGAMALMVYFSIHIVAETVVQSIEVFTQFL